MCIYVCKYIYITYANYIYIYEGNGNPLQYPRLENPMEEGAWQATIHRVAKSQTQLNDFTSLHIYIRCMYKIYHTHINTLGLIIKTLILELLSRPKCPSL